MSCGKLTFALVALCMFGGTQAGDVTTSPCPNVVGNGTFSYIDIAGCQAGYSCIKPANVFHDFTVVFQPSNADIEPWLRLTVTGRASRGNSEIQTIGFRQLEGELFTLVPGLMRFPRLGNDLDDFDVRFLIESSNGVEVCRTIVMTVVEYGEIELEGSAPGDACPNVTPGEPCGFRGSECVLQNGNKVCMCDRQSTQEDRNGVAICQRRTSWKCSSDHECVSNAVCAAAGTERACRCGVDSFESTNSVCLKNGGAAVSDACDHPNIPCGFPYSLCTQDNECVCNSDAAIDATSNTCKLQPAKGGCTTDEDCAANATCRTLASGETTCACKPGYANENMGCVAYNFESTSVGASCQKTNVTCGFENSLCGSDNKCACDTGFAAVENTCVLPAGSGCGSNDECGGNAYCGRNEKGEDQCLCKAGFESSVSTGACVKVAGTAINSECTARGAQCKFPNSVCGGSEALTCGCIEEAIEQDGQCRIKAAMTCTSNPDCVSAATCNNIGSNGNGVCVCVNPDTQTDEGKCSNADVVVFYSPLLVVALMALILNK